MPFFATRSCQLEYSANFTGGVDGHYLRLTWRSQPRDRAIMQIAVA
jgi:hypothetical protein